MTEYEKTLNEKKEREAYHIWEKLVNTKLPGWASRVFALRSKRSNYSLENELGEVIKIANGHGYNTGYKSFQDFMEQTILNDVLVEAFLDHLEKAEKENNNG